jgi:phosphopentomutase
VDRVILIVLDSVGAGALPDAALYGDEGANTIGHVAEQAGLHLPHLNAIGFSRIPGCGLPADSNAAGGFGRLTEVSPGKDTTTGHWEMAGVRLPRPFPTYPDGFPPEVMDAFEEAIGTGTLGNKAASGTDIIKELGEEHVRTGYPIVYTSADSVFQIAAHEGVIPLPRLYEMCVLARGILQGPHALGRVIARPFLGASAADFYRTPGRRDFSLPPIGETMLDALSGSGLDVLAVGKIDDIFSGRGITKGEHSAGNPACMDTLAKFLKQPFRGLCFVNLVDFDMVYGHRRDAQGYADALMYFDGRLPEVTAVMDAGDLLLITADHGCDPTFRGTDHTREYAPLIAWRPGMKKTVDLGIRATFADIAATVCDALGVDRRFGAISFLKELEGS